MAEKISGTHFQDAVAERTSSKEARVSLRAIILGAVSLAIVTAILVSKEFGDVRRGLPLNIHIVPNQFAIAVVLLLVIVGSIFKKKLNINKQELVVVYIFIFFAVFYSQLGLLVFQLGNMNSLIPLSHEHPAVYTPILKEMSSWLALTDEVAVMEFWLGDAEVPWLLWLKPIITWTMFYGALLFVTICSVTIIRHHWIDRELLRFPTTLPVLELALSSEDGKDVVPFWKKRLLLLGLIYPGLFYGSQIMSKIVPGFPLFARTLWLNTLFEGADAPFNVLATSNWMFSFDPILIGVAFLVSSVDILFSVWFFDILLLRVIPVVQTGVLGSPDIIRLNWRAIGGGVFIGVILIILWTMRNDLKQIIRYAITQSGHIDHTDENEPMSYRTALFGGAIGFVALTLFGVFAMGWSAFPFVVFLVVFFLISLGFARLRAEAGWPQLNPGIAGLGNNIVRLFGLDRIGSSKAAYFLGSHLFPMYYGFFGASGANALESFKLADAVGLSKKDITKILFLAFGISAIVGYVTALPYIYDRGFFSVRSLYVDCSGLRWSFAHRTDIEQDVGLISWWYGSGIVIGAVLMILRTKYIWFPLHPLAVAMAGVDYTMFMFGPFFLAWAIKLIMYRYGGNTLVKRFNDFFIGMMLGGVVLYPLDMLVLYLL